MFRVRSPDLICIPSFLIGCLLLLHRGYRVAQLKPETFPGHLQQIKAGLPVRQLEIRRRVSTRLQDFQIVGNKHGRRCIVGKKHPIQFFLQFESVAAS